MNIKGQTYSLYILKNSICIYLERRKQRLSILLLSIWLVVSGCSVKWMVRSVRLPKKPIPEIQNELRGIWITRFNWAHTDPDTMKNQIINIMRQTAEANFNAVFFQVRGQAETLYPSPIEAWSKLVDGKDPGSDLVEFAIEEAHRYGLKFYAYINLLTLWNEEQPPKDTNHLYFTHGPYVGKDISWVCFGQDGQPMQLNEYYYLNPALPEVKSYLKKVIRHIVRNYDLDGLHFDRIRYPGADYIYDPYSVRQFMEDSLQSPVTRDEWARQKLTDLVEDVVAEALIIKPYLVISAATWGLYRTNDIKGYEHFGSGYQHYYQDAIDWLNKGIMDFIVPMIYWDIRNPLPNFYELWTNFKSRTPFYQNIYPGLRVNRNWLINGETVSQINYVRQNGGLGHAMFSFSALGNNGLQIVHDILYPNKVEVPQNLNRGTAEQVVTLKMDQLMSQSFQGRNVRIKPSARIKTADSEGYIGFVLLQKPDTINIVAGEHSVSLNTRWWSTPFKYIVQPEGAIKRGAPWVEFRSIAPDTTTDPEFHLLCKTDYPAKVNINGDSVKQYKTGIFFDKITLIEGSNRIRAHVMSADSSFAMYEHEIFYKKAEARKPFPLWIDEQSVEPSMDQILLPDDQVRIRFKGSKGQQAVARIHPGKTKITFSLKDYSDYSLYRAELPVRLLKKGKNHYITFFLKSYSSDFKNAKYRFQIKASIGVKAIDEFPLIRTTKPNSILYCNLGEIRLGSPVIAEFDPGVVLKVNGRIGEHYRIFLNRNETGFIHMDYVEELPVGTVKPSYYIQSISITPSKKADIVRIPYPEHVPYAVHPEPDQNRITISLYGVKTSSTRITHHNNLRVIEKVTWQQVNPDTYQVIINLKTSKIWGYDIETRGSSLIFHVKYPPDVSVSDSSLSLEGLKLAIEAGHGGGSFGAVSLSGIFEKDINLDVAQKLAGICRTHGIEVFQVRDRDRDMSLDIKRDTVEASDAHLLVSIHANASGSRGGFLGVDGTSTYYHNPFWAKFAEIVYKHLLELELNEFGIVGSFNYRVTRMSSRPAILVEQAFLSHAEDEEKLATEEFRQKIAQKIFDGVVEYVKYMLK